MAYFPLYMVPGLCIYPFRGQPRQCGEASQEYVRGMVPDRAMAWRVVEFCIMGLVLLPAAGIGEIPAGR